VVIVGRFHGTDPAEPARMVRDLHIAGVSVTGANVADLDQVRAMTAGIAQAAADDGRDFPPVIGVDQEGGYVSHLRGIATEFPHFASAGQAIAADHKEGRRATRVAALTTALELRGLGFTDAELEAVERAFVTQVAPEDVAAMVVEPVLGEGGFVVPPPNFLPGLREICDRYGIVLIVDEVQTGFGRTGRFFAVEHWGVEPDLLVVAKSIAAGLPLSGVIGKEAIMDAAPD